MHNQQMLKVTNYKHYIIIYYLAKDINSVGAKVYIQDLFNEDVIRPFALNDWSEDLAATIDVECVELENNITEVNKIMKKDYKKIDIYFMGNYVASTTWRKTCKDAIKAWAKSQGVSTQLVQANFAK